MELKKQRNRNDVLKLIAIVTMLIDHIGFFFYPDILMLRSIGRISFPIFCYYLAMGYGWTSNKSRYALRIFLFAMISQAPYIVFSFATSGKANYNPLMLNVLFLLFIGIIMLYFFENSFFFSNLRKNDSEEDFSVNSGLDFLKKVFFTMAFFAIVLAPTLLRLVLTNVSIFGSERTYSFSLSYGTYGLILILIFFVFKNNAFAAIISFGVLSGLDVIMSNFLPYSSPGSKIFQAQAIYGVLIIYVLKDMNFAFRMPKWFAYWFYPIHLGILGLIDYFNII